MNQHRGVIGERIYPLYLRMYDYSALLNYIINEALEKMQFRQDEIFEKSIMLHRITCKRNTQISD